MTSATFLPGAVTAAPGTGTATINSTYSVQSITNVQTVGTNTTGDSALETGAIALTADFLNKRLTGTGGDLTVNGNFGSALLTGTVRYRGVDGTIVSGLVGATEAVGAFNGRNAAGTAGYSGGFVNN